MFFEWIKPYIYVSPWSCKQVARSDIQAENKWKQIKHNVIEHFCNLPDTLINNINIMLIEKVIQMALQFLQNIFAFTN